MPPTVSEISESFSRSSVSDSSVSIGEYQTEPSIPPEEVRHQALAQEFFSFNHLLPLYL